MLNQRGGEPSVQSPNPGANASYQIKTTGSCYKIYLLSSSQLYPLSLIPPLRLSVDKWLVRNVLKVCMHGDKEIEEEKCLRILKWIDKNDMIS